MNEDNGSFRDMMKFVSLDWPIVLTGVLLYGVIGSSYPIIGALMADINVVCFMCSNFCVSARL